MKSEVWVYTELGHDKSIKKVSQELLSAAARLVEKTEEELVAVIFGYEIEKESSEIARYADKVIMIDDRRFKYYGTERYTDAFTKLIRKYKPSTILIGATANGRDLAPRVACRMGTGLTADCTGLDIDEESGKVAWTRPAFGGKLMAAILCPDRYPQIGTIRPGVFEKTELPEKNGKIIYETFDDTAPEVKVIHLDFQEKKLENIVNLSEAEFIVSGGRGVGGKGGFEKLKELADVLGGSIGASRAAVDSGWIGHEYQVGQTGQSVKPKVYFACGISGAVQHTVAITKSDIIVAINRDKNADIFKVADYKIIGDLHTVIPALTKEIKQLKLKKENQ